MNLPTGLGDPGKLAMFLDFDGTLVEIEERPNAVALASATRAALVALRDATDGALAVVTGRDIDCIDAFLAPLRLPVAGVHGLTRRDAAGELRHASLDMSFPARAAAQLAPLIARAPNLLVEQKSSTLALHYRQAPELEHDCLVQMQRIAEREPGVRVTRNKMVIEVRPEGADKGSAIADFMREAPFAGRVPVVAGDDVTDEDAFAVVNALGGMTIKIGDGPTAARFRARDTATFLAWLHDAAAQAATRGSGAHHQTRPSAGPSGEETF